VPIQQAEERFREIYETRRDKTLFLIGAGNVRYGEIMAVIDAAMGAGVDKIGGSPTACVAKRPAAALADSSREVRSQRSEARNLARFIRE